jgi:hypothetical protein
LSTRLATPTGGETISVNRGVGRRGVVELEQPEVTGDHGHRHVVDRDTFDADRIVLFTHEGENRRYREDLDDQEIRERFGRPVDHAVA